MKELAIELNNILKDSCVYDLLGKKGKMRRMNTFANVSPS